MAFNPADMQPAGAATLVPPEQLGMREDTYQDIPAAQRPRQQWVTTPDGKQFKHVTDPRTGNEYYESPRVGEQSVAFTKGADGEWVPSIRDQGGWSQLTKNATKDPKFLAFLAVAAGGVIASAYAGGGAMASGAVAEGTIPASQAAAGGASFGSAAGTGAVATATPVAAPGAITATPLAAAAPVAGTASLGSTAVAAAPAAGGLFGTGLTAAQAASIGGTVWQYFRQGRQADALAEAQRQAGEDSKFKPYAVTGSRLGTTTFGPDGTASIQAGAEVDQGITDSMAIGNQSLAQAAAMAGKTPQEMGKEEYDRYLEYTRPKQTRLLDANIANQIARGSLGSQSGSGGGNPLIESMSAGFADSDYRAWGTSIDNSMARFDQLSKRGYAAFGGAGVLEGLARGTGKWGQELGDSAQTGQAAAARFTTGAALTDYDSDTHRDQAIVNGVETAAGLFGGVRKSTPEEEDKARMTASIRSPSTRY